MRVFFSGPRIFGIRPGVSFGREDFARATGGAAGPSQILEGGFVYVVESKSLAGRIKIGRTQNPRRRLATLQTGSPHALQFAYLATSPSESYVQIEAEAQAILARQCCNGEWFTVSSEAAIAAISVAAHRLGIPLLPVTLDQADEILRIAATMAADAPDSKKQYLPTPETPVKAVVWAGIGSWVTIFISLLTMNPAPFMLWLIVAGLYALVMGAHGLRTQGEKK